MNNKTWKVHYAWIILLIGFIALLSAQGVRLSFGAFMKPWEEEFAASRSTISTISLISYIVFALSQPYIGKLVDTYGVRHILSYSMLLIGVSTILTFFASAPWQLMLIYGVITSIGFGGASNVVGSVAITKWFSAQRGFALGLMSAGTAAGQLVLVPVSLLLIESFGWKQTVLLLGFILCLLIFPPLWLFLRNSPEESGRLPYGESAPETIEKGKTPIRPLQPVSIFQLIKQKRFLFLMVPFFVCGVTTTGLMDTHLIPFAQLCGFSPAVIGSAVSTLAAFNILGTVLSGHLSDKWNCKYMLAFLYGMRALTVCLLLVMLHDSAFLGFVIDKSWLLFAFAVMFGVVDFATVAPTIKLASEYFKHISVGTVIGWLYLSHQIGSALGSYVPGVLFDLSGGYDVSILSSIGFLVIAAALSFILPAASAHLLQQPSYTNTTKNG
ncbi:MFS transporter [Bacillus songklensis]|uniref:MFS transporter n=1 Tax=Bacillus songklensis TaxID=1069116 RepID=A0ABV8B702_9BACI